MALAFWYVPSLLALRLFLPSLPQNSLSHDGKDLMETSLSLCIMSDCWSLYQFNYAARGCFSHDGWTNQGSMSISSHWIVTLGCYWCYFHYVLSFWHRKLSESHQKRNITPSQPQTVNNWFDSRSTPQDSTQTCRIWVTKNLRLCSPGASHKIK